MPFKIAGMVGGGVIGFLFFIAVVWFISALFWGGVAFLVWNDAGLYHVFHGAGTLDYFWQSVGVGAGLSLVLG